MPLDPLHYYTRRAQAYRDVFRSPQGLIVLADLIRFCRALKTTHVIGDPTGSAQLEGRRQVWLRIQDNIHADETHIRRVLEQESE